MCTGGFSNFSFGNIKTKKYCSSFIKVRKDIANGNIKIGGNTIIIKKLLGTRQRKQRQEQKNKDTRGGTVIVLQSLIAIIYDYRDCD